MFIIRLIKHNLHHLRDEWLGVDGGHGHLKKREIFETVFDFFAVIYLTTKCIKQLYCIYLCHQK